MENERKFKCIGCGNFRIIEDFDFDCCPLPLYCCGCGSKMIEEEEED